MCIYTYTEIHTYIYYKYCFVCICIYISTGMKKSRPSACTEEGVCQRVRTKGGLVGMSVLDIFFYNLLQQITCALKFYFYESKICSLLKL